MRLKKSHVLHPIGISISERLQSLRGKLDKRKEEMHGFIVSWDVDRRDASLNARLRRFVFGYDVKKNGKDYRYPGLVEREGVLHLGQSVLFLCAETFPALWRYSRCSPGGAV